MSNNNTDDKGRLVLNDPPDWIIVKEQLPPPFVRVMTYSPMYQGACENMREGVAILCWNPDEQRWCDDNGESPIFTPYAWWHLSIPTKKQKRKITDKT